MGTLLTWEQNTGKFPFHSVESDQHITSPQDSVHLLTKVYKYKNEENHEPFKVLTMTINENTTTIGESLFTIFTSLA